MGKRTGSGGSNPVMAQRRAERKREIEKNKKKREGYREAALMYADPEKLQLEISQLQRQQLTQTDAKQDNLLKKRLEELQKHLRVCLAKRAGGEVLEDSSSVHVSGLDFLGEDDEDEDNSDDDDEEELLEEDGEEDEGEEGEEEGATEVPPSHLPPTSTLSVPANSNITSGNHPEEDNSEWEFEEDDAAGLEEVGKEEKALNPPLPMPIAFLSPSDTLLQAPYFPPPYPLQFPSHPMYPLPPPFPLPPGIPSSLPPQAGPSVSQTLPQHKRRREGDMLAFKPGKRQVGRLELDTNDPLAKAYSGDKLVHLNRTFDAAPAPAGDKPDPVVQKPLPHPPSFLAASFPPPPPLPTNTARTTTHTSATTIKQPPLAPPKLPAGMKALVPVALRRPFVASSGGDAGKVASKVSSVPLPSSLPALQQNPATTLPAPIVAPSSVLGPRGVAILRRPEVVTTNQPPQVEDLLGAFFAELEDLSR